MKISRGQLYEHLEIEFLSCLRTWRWELPGAVLKFAVGHSPELPILKALRCIEGEGHREQCDAELMHKRGNRDAFLRTCFEGRPRPQKLKALSKTGIKNLQVCDIT